jgi:3-phosphoshikimate 1-carboxyvinyltransferase
MTTWYAHPGSALSGAIAVPGDKSVSHRAIMLASLADGRSRIEGFLEGEDTRATARAFAAMGVRIDSPQAGVREIEGVGLDGLTGVAGAIDCGNAGTGMRLLAGVLAGQRFDTTLVGDASLSRRPMGRVVDPLTAMGARIETAEGGRPPLIIHGNNVLQGIDYKTPVASAQVKSAVLLAGLYAHGETVVREPTPTRDYTERMLATFGWPVDISPGRVALTGGRRLRATDVRVPADFSSAAFFLVAASVIPGSDLLLRRVGVNARRIGLLHALRAMGADITVNPVGAEDGEPVADLRVRYARLRGIDVDPAWAPDMIDEFPALFVAAALADGVSRIRGAAELRVKESDRIKGMADALRALGAEIVEYPDGADIVGGRLRGGQVDSLGDHRLAMAMAVAAQCAEAEVIIDDCANVDTSFPGFAELAADVGFGLRGG